MATLVLTAAGSLLGPIGGAAGALIGQAIDGRILRPSGREGPRLQDLRIQASSYGVPLPKVFGTMRMAGTVIWSTDLIETRRRGGGGKGRPATTSYSYSASFAVALSARPIRSVRRIWADGNLLRGAAGDWKQETGFRLHLGGEDQSVDPLIASAEGSAGTPAYRGCAYAVFENMALEPYGNRIPSLTFEVEADAAPVAVGQMIEELTDSVIGGEGGGEVLGFAATADSQAALVEELAKPFSLEFRDTGERLELRSSEEPPVQLSPDEILEGSRSERPAAAATPAALTLSYYDPARDYQIGIQSAGRTTPTRATRRLELPASLTAAQAQALAGAMLQQDRRSQLRRTVQCGWQRLCLEQGSVVSLGDDNRRWRVHERVAERDGVRLELKALNTTSIVPRAVEPGRTVPAPDQIHGPTRIALLDLPNLADEAPGVPTLAIAAWGDMAGWRRAALLISFDGNSSWQPVGATAPSAVAGTTENALLAGGTATIDGGNELVVQLAHDEMLLEDADDALLLNERNLALVGNELVQFGSALPLGGGRWRLSRLLRGRRGTEGAVDTHVAGERFVLIEQEALVAAQVPLGQIGQALGVMASGVGDPTPIQQNILFAGESLRPPSPVHLSARLRADGGFDVRWVRRSRAGWSWGDVDAPLGEASERYRLVIRLADGAERSLELDQPRHHYEAATVSADREGGSFIDLSVAQIGTFAVSRAATIRILIGEI